MSVVRERQANFELLRILAMLGVLVSHIFNYGLHIYENDGPDFTVDTSSAGGFTLWSLLQLIKLVALVSVNCYVLISGYFLAGGVQLRWRGIWRVWSTTWIYSMFFYLLFVVLGQDSLSWQALFVNATPLLHNTFWFVTSYLALILMSPLLSYVSCRLNHWQYMVLLTAGFVCCFQFLLGNYLMSEQQILLFVYLYFIGGYISKFHAESKGNISVLMACFIGMLGMMYAITVYKNIIRGDAAWLVFGMAYNGLVLPLSVLVFLLFRRMSITQRFAGAVCAVAPLSFAVYVIHTQPNVHVWLWSLLTEWFYAVPQWTLPVFCLLTAVSVFIICVIIEKGRRSIQIKIGKS